MTSLTQISTALYHYLCHHVVGTEEIVKTKRMLNTVNDSFKSMRMLKYLTSGSFGEGLEMKGSDLDIMLIEKPVNIYESFDNYDPEKVNFFMNAEGSKPGFTKLKLVTVGGKLVTVDGKLVTVTVDGKLVTVDGFMVLMHNNCLKIGNEFYLSNILYRNTISSDKRFTLHGPCVSDGNTDLAYTLQSKIWVTPASHWLHRAHSQWPRHDVKVKVVECGVLFVPIGVKGSDDEELEWRISFSAAEKLLIYSFNHTQLLCYALMKILLKDIIERDSRCTSKLCSYYIKTIVFWVSEEQPLSVWSPENLIPCFLRCFQRLIYCVKYSICPHYFIPENNMFENRIEGFVRQILLENITVLYSDGWRCLLTSKQMSNFKPLTPLQVEFNSFQHYFRHIITSGAMYRHRKVRLDHSICLCKCRCCCCYKMGIYGITHFLQYQSSNIKSYCVYGISLQSLETAQLIKLTTQKGNKDTYTRYNTCLAYLLLNTHHDAVSGWLMLASCFYKMKQYKQALNILSYSLSKCNPEKITYRETLCEINCFRTKPVLSHKTWKSMGILRTIATLFLEPVMLISHNKLIPNELEMFVESQSKLLIPPDVFAHFLCFMCHYHLRDVKQYRCSLNDLHRTITHTATWSDLGPIILYSSKDTYIKFCCLGIAYEVIKDFDSARNAYLKAVKEDPKNVFIFALQRLSMMDTK